MPSSPAETRIQIRWQPKQRQLWDLVDNSLFTWLGFGGARGGAKSHAARMIQIARRLKYPNTNGLIFRKTYNDLYENHILPLFSQYPMMRDWYNKSEKILYLPNGSWIKFGYAEHHDDIFEFFGKAYADICIDEATDLEQDQIEFLGTCNRCTTSTALVPKMLLTMNPGRIGHAYIKRVFIDKIYDDNEVPDAFTFLQAFGWDNVEWCRKSLEQDHTTVAEYYSWSDEKRFEYFITRSDYGRKLNALPDADRKAHLLGDWDTFAGMFFKQFTRNKNTIKPFEIPQEWPLVLAVDPGWSSPVAASILVRDYNGTIYVVSTYYEAALGHAAHAEGIKKMIAECSFTHSRMPSTKVAGKDAWAKKDRYAIMASDATFADVFSEHGLFLERAQTDRHQGWWTWKSLFPDHFFIFKEFNKPVVDEMATVVTDDVDVEDILGRGNDDSVPDHALDEVRYGIMSIYKPMKVEVSNSWEDEWLKQTRENIPWQPGMG